jgi:hypothetical protein
MAVVPIRGDEQDEELFQTLAVWTLAEAVRLVTALQAAIAHVGGGGHG